jgi:hypothetical protein
MWLGMFALFSASIPDAAAAAFEYTGSLNTARQYHTATLLSDGSVMVAGGSNRDDPFPTGGPPFPSVEIYHPLTGTWTVTNAMTVARRLHTATKLSDGRVLVAGGDGGYEIIHRSCELYTINNTNGPWVNTGSMNQDKGRAQHTATLLPDGKVLVTGGWNYYWRAVSSSELYSPNTGLWTSTGSMNTNRSGHTATLLPNGQVLVAGGWENLGPTKLSSTELYDPATEQWTPSGSMSFGRADHTATLLSNGKVLIAGGSATGGSALPTSELYDPATGTWTLTGNQNTARGNHTATLLPDGKVLIAGGNQSTTQYSAELYDPATGQWTWTGGMIHRRAFHTATLLQNGFVLLAGGGADYLNTAELFDSGNADLPAGLNLLSGQALESGDIRLSFTGISRWRYALQRSHSLSPANWQSLVTNLASPNGDLVITNSPLPYTNNFWRIMSVP